MPLAVSGGSAFVGGPGSGNEFLESGSKAVREKKQSRLAQTISQALFRGSTRGPQHRELLLSWLIWGKRCNSKFNPYGLGLTRFTEFGVKGQMYL